MRNLGYVKMGFIFAGMMLPMAAFSLQLNSAFAAGILNSSVQVIQADNDTLPLANNPGELRRPIFETIHLVVGFGAMYSDFSNLDQLNVNKSNFTPHLSLQARIPFQLTGQGLYFTGGWDISTNPTFKGLLLYQTPFRLIFGVGGGRTQYIYESDDLRIEAYQNHALLALGVNLLPRNIDFLVTVPVGQSLYMRFENHDYTIRPAGVQMNFLISFR